MYNLFALALFGSILEHIIGSRRFLVLFLAAGILANILAVFFYPSSLGASGAIFGVLGALVVLRPGMIVWAFSLPMPMFLAGIIWAIGDLIGLFIPSDVGHIAHLAGMGIGIIYGFFVRGRFKEFRRSSRSFVLDERAMRDWEDNYMR
jgi:membrane associated rhomboid family serine protease